MSNNKNNTEMSWNINPAHRCMTDARVQEVQSSLNSKQAMLDAAREEIRFAV